jgi:hypothetical protein
LIAMNPQKRFMIVKRLGITERTRKRGRARRRVFVMPRLLKFGDECLARYGSVADLAKNFRIRRQIDIDA